MRIRELRVTGFRNLAAQTLRFEGTLTVLAGDNGQGKTNVLEATYLLAGLRSFRTNKLAECVRFGEAAAAVLGHVERGPHRHSVEVRLHGAGRSVLVDGKPLRTARDYAGELNAIVFVPEDLALPRGAPDARRKLLDRGVFAAQPAHLRDLLDYERALRGRNVLLRDGVTGARLAAQTEVLARLGAQVLARRLAWVTALQPRLSRAFEDIAASPLPCALRYEARAVALPPDDVHPAHALEARLAEALHRTTAADLARGHTTVGPHADDLQFTLEGRPLRVAGSQGQQRAYVLAYKLAEIDAARDDRGQPPVLLLDDVGSELDETRRAALFRHLTAPPPEVRAQVLVTTTATSLLGPLLDAQVYEVRAGACSLREAPKTA